MHLRIDFFQCSAAFWSWCRRDKKMYLIEPYLRINAVPPLAFTSVEEGEDWKHVSAIPGVFIEYQSSKV
jgi:hypothetical protein